MHYCKLFFLRPLVNETKFHKASFFKSFCASHTANKRNYKFTKLSWQLQEIWSNIQCPWLSRLHPGRVWVTLIVCVCACVKRQKCFRLYQLSVRFKPPQPSCQLFVFLKKNTFYHLALLTMTFNWERERRGVQVMRGAVTNCWIKVMAWPWSFLSDDPQHWPRQSSARKQTLSSAWGENCAPFDACVSLNTLLSTHFYKQIVNALPRAKVHKNQLIESSLRVSTIQHASFSRQDSNRCTLDLVTESLFYPLLTNFTSFPPLLTHIHSFSISFFKSFTIPLHRLLLFLLPVKSSERCCMSGQRRDRSVFSVMLSDCCAASVHQVSHLPRQAHSTLWNQTALRLNREQMLYTSPELQTTSLSL